ncbi:TrmH family RNA methyltransferase [Candidatus Haliotispira prima]|uniref:Putative tRNA (cytidine(34)-2'-O)-methyltransferase n=1 Tax=Candidatus Haliotispira prima TaxID=3034016 RepID=A0ABY8MHZ5_9SPIO|nr:TrmH family RNA methyltransferase [Candidatus Haliotispira prima]
MPEKGPEKQLKIVLFRPEIPHNVGAAIRLCAGMNGELHLIRPLGFTVNDRHLERVALGYHEVLRPVLHNNPAAFLDSLSEDEELYLFSSGANMSISQIRAGSKVALLFGSETSGLNALNRDESSRLRLERRSLFSVRIPQAGNFRCHNLSNSIAMGAYEILRQWQWDFPCRD